MASSVFIWGLFNYFSILYLKQKIKCDNVLTELNAIKTVYIL